ncbi:MAG: alkyl hydroperoxide reductase [Bacteroidetes bacterium RIFOXYA12_FULL_35_11]|nr:MAG: alkyl hydroperoxide reductase [Bacteroidetes bacterium GWF2_35_48]OFY74829.1 MAG: alkyl hydroperoxide reductase [Bacteroidetes bacterium RIFOXYA12_FULL_35_11]
MVLNFQLLAQDINLKIHLRGVSESKITLLPLIGANALKPLIEKQGIKNGETVTISIPDVFAPHGAHLLPGEFILRFDYKEKETSTPYPSEKHIFISNQDLELWVNPPYCNNSDSTWFQKDEKENTLFALFTKENSKQKEKLGLLQNFLMNYDDAQSPFYMQGIEEYEKRRNNYNQWLTEQSVLHKALFVSHGFQFQHVPRIAFNGSEIDRLKNVIAHYFDGIDFQDTLLLHTNELKSFITTYVNMYASLSKTQANLDSLYPLIGKKAIEKARLGNPKVYGWMVDYFYNGYESFNMQTGLKMLESYINDTTCLTNKRQAIEKRLTGIKTLVVGTVAPDFIINPDLTGFNNLSGLETGLTFHQCKTNSHYKLLLFWSADCGHCKELVHNLYTWLVNTPHGAYPLAGAYPLVDVFALSLDNTETEISIWENAITQLKGWRHIRCEGGINSKEANAYFILSAPVMILVDARTNKIIAFPENTGEVNRYLEEMSINGKI